MQIEIVEYKDNEDGGATITLDLDEAGRQFLIERGFNSIIKEEIEKLDTTVNEGWWTHHCIKKDSVISFEKGNVCDWCGISEEIARNNRDTIEKIKQYEEWKKDESPPNQL